MPLSEDDQRKLDQIEQALAKDDPQFAETVNTDRWRRRRIALAGASPARSARRTLLAAMGRCTTPAARSVQSDSVAGG